MEVQSPKSKTGKRRYVRQRPYVKTPARVAAYMANFEKMVAAPKEKRYPPSPKRDAANMKNLEKAWATPRKPSAARVDQEELCKHLDGLFPAYPPPGQPPADPVGAIHESPRVTEGEKGEKGKRENSQEPISRAGGVGTKPECSVESTDSYPTSPLRIQQDAGIRDSESGDREPGVGDSDSGPNAGPESESRMPNAGHHDKAPAGPDQTATNDQSAIGNRQSAIPEPRTPDPDPGGVGTEPECGAKSTDNCPTSPSRIQAQEPGSGVRDSGFGTWEPESSTSGLDGHDDTKPEPELRTPDPETAHQDKPQPGQGATPLDDQSATGSRPIRPQARTRTPNPGSRTPHAGPDPPAGGVGTKPECAAKSTDNCPTSPSRIQQDAGIGDSESAAREPGSDGPRHDADDDAGPESESQTPDPEFEHQEKPRQGADAADDDDQSTIGNRQCPIPCCPTAPQPYAKRPSGSGSVADTSPAKPGAKAAK